MSRSRSVSVLSTPSGSPLDRWPQFQPLKQLVFVATLGNCTPPSFSPAAFFSVSFLLNCSPFALGNGEQFFHPQTLRPRTNVDQMLAFFCTLSTFNLIHLGTQPLMNHDINKSELTEGTFARLSGSEQDICLYQITHLFFSFFSKEMDLNFPSCE